VIFKRPWGTIFGHLAFFHAEALGHGAEEREPLIFADDALMVCSTITSVFRDKRLEQEATEIAENGFDCGILPNSLFSIGLAQRPLRLCVIGFSV
jgi:hypothetical protein